MAGMGVLSKLAVKAAKTALKDAPYFPPGSPERAANLARAMEGVYPSLLRETREPRVLYHGTDAEDGFPAFDMAKSEDLGAHFGTRAAANRRLRALGATEDRVGHILPVHLALKNPLRLPDLGTWSEGNLIEALGGIVPSGVLNRIGRDISNMGDPQKALADLKAAIVKQRYDGIVYDNSFEGGGNSYVAFDPRQIKSIFNRGTFDRKNPDMLKARGGRVSSFAVRR